MFGSVVAGIGAIGILLATMPHLFVYERILGIDLGTTYSVACVCSGGNITIVPANAGVVGPRGTEQFTVPSVVSYLEDGTAVIGEAARKRRVAHSHDTVFDAKRLIGRPYEDPVVSQEAGFLPFTLLNDTATGRVGIRVPARSLHVMPEDVGAAILKELKLAAEAEQGLWKRLLGFRFNTATISVPVIFHGGQRRATEIAGQRAGFKMVRVIEEPVAAALAYELHSKGSKNVLVYDFGGGTLDVAVLVLTPDTRGFLIRGTAGDPHLGGEDFDRNLVKDIYARLATWATSKGLPDPTSDEELQQHVWDEAERAKQRLQAVQDGQRVKSATITLDVGDQLFETAITVEEFDAMSSELYDRALAPVEEALKEADIRPEDIQDVVLVGGSSRLYQIRQNLARVFSNQQIHSEIDPDLAIAVGAARAYGC